MLSSIDNILRGLGKAGKAVEHIPGKTAALHATTPSVWKGAAKGPVMTPHPRMPGAKAKKALPRRGTMPSMSPMPPPMRATGATIGPTSRFIPGNPKPPKVRTGWDKRAHDAANWVKGHKKLVAGAGGLAIAGTAISNSTGPGSPKGSGAQARGMYGF